MSETLTRRDELLRVAADLFAHRGFHGVSVNDIGRAAGVSGPAIYRHFASKDAMLAEMLIAISEELLRVGRERAGAADRPAEGVRALVAWHADFALRERALIVVQDRDWSSLPDEAREQVRALQREYVDLLVAAQRGVHPRLDRKTALARAHAVFNLLNSTPRSSYLPTEQMRAELEGMALRALDVSDRPD
ncbi:TetR/AcrR family transcriptional regulator [Nocardioides massiliensis]|uniref:AcrR family transcriptional regulator n=1 Tax=Nocardioides massiliensis TaxID=1325935 RepID=A0ABT9NLE3_9ACTN|nr:TetR/AcrR family transcriptional regulator [Nocardioides massiliensis]MDP9821247.1 AcrR family transcriptional regulator [Nocardioides massiliensis]